MKANVVQHFGALLWQRARGASIRSVLWMLVLAATEGAGLLLLVPLLALAGVVPVSAGAGPWWTAASAYLPHSLGLVLTAYVCIMALRALAEVFAAASSARVEAVLTGSLRDELYRALVRARWDVVVRLRSARLAHVLTAELDRVTLATNQLLHAALDSAVALAYVIAAFALLPALALVATVVALLLVGMSMTQQSAALRDGERLSTLGGALFTGAVEELQTLKIAKSSGVAEAVASRFILRSRQYAEAWVEVQRRWTAGRSALAVGAAAALALVVYVAVTQLHLGAARLLLLLYVCARLVPRITALHGSILLSIRAMPAARSVQDMLASLTDAEQPPDDRIARVNPPVRTIALQRVTYRYPEAATPALRDVSIEIPVGGVTALVGPSGAGKSTVADLLLCLLEPEQGTLTLDGHSLPREAGAAWRAMVGYVPQEPLLFHDTVRENLRWLSPSADDVAIAVALHRAGATKLVARLAHGLDTVIGDRGVLLSGGERQRLAIARALLRDPRLLVMDEATNALDAESEAALRTTIAALAPAVTVLTITHRLTSARLADHVVVLDEGCVIAAGRWDDLVRAPGSRLAMLWAAQMGAAPPRSVPAEAGRSSREDTALHT